MDPIDDLAEKFESLEHKLEAAGQLESPARRTFITLAIVVVTLTGGVIGYNGASAARMAASNAAEQQALNMDAQLASVNAVEEVVSTDALFTDRKELKQRADLTAARAATPPKGSAATAARQLAQDERAHASDLNKLWARLDAEATVTAQHAVEAGTVSIAWSDRKGTDVAVLGLLAVSLFLLGSAHRGHGVVGNGLIGVASVLVLFGVVLAVHAAWTPIPHYDSAIPSYATGIERLDEGDYAGAAAAFENAAKVNPKYLGAWEMAGLARLFSYSQVGLEGAVRDYGQAIALKDRTAVTFNNLAYAENLLGRYTAALGHIESAHELRPNDELVLLGRALTLFAVGEPERARQDEAVALSRMTRYSAGYREAFFDNLRDGAAHLHAAHPAPQHLDEYIQTIREAEASLDAIGTWKPRPTSARISDLKITRTQDRAVVSFDVGEMPNGATLSSRWYDAGGKFEPRLSYAKWRWSGMKHVELPSRRPPSGFHSVEIYVNGNLILTTQMTI